MADLGLQPKAGLQAVAIDLRDDWPAALTQAGFDPTEPAAWLAEGLLGYLPAEAQVRLLDQITALSAPGSRLATEDPLRNTAANEEEERSRMQRQSNQWSKHGFDLDMAALMYFDDRTSVSTYLADNGWDAFSSCTNDMLTKHGLPLVDPDDALFGNMVYLSAVLP